MHKDKSLWTKGGGGTKKHHDSEQSHEKRKWFGETKSPKNQKKMKVKRRM